MRNLLFPALVATLLPITMIDTAYGFDVNCDKTLGIPYSRVLELSVRNLEPAGKTGQGTASDLSMLNGYKYGDLVMDGHSIETVSLPEVKVIRTASDITVSWRTSETCNDIHTKADYTLEIPRTNPEFGSTLKSNSCREQVLKGWFSPVTGGFNCAIKVSAQELVKLIN